MEKDTTPLTAGEKKAKKAAEAAAAKAEADAAAAAQEAATKAEADAAMAAAAKPKTDPYEALASQYAQLYPDNDVFHITSDKQVFLSKDMNQAQLHQNSLNNGEMVKSIKTK